MAKVVNAEVYFVASPFVDDDGIADYLRSIGAEWQSNAASGDDFFMEVAGRVCYKSFGTELNKNLTRVRDDNAEYLGNIIKSGHGRILEHINCSFIIHNVSRVFTHEFITHKVGTTQSQESLRFVRLDELRVYVPDVMKKYNMDEYFLRKMQELEEWQREMSLMFKLDEKSFEEKKIITSAMRRLAPMGLCTTVMWTANLRAIRHILEQRTNRHAEEEIRKVMDQVGSIMQERFQVVFEDFSRNDIGEWKAKYAKV